MSKNDFDIIGERITACCDWAEMVADSGWIFRRGRIPYNRGKLLFFMQFHLMAWCELMPKFRFFADDSISTQLRHIPSPTYKCCAMIVLFSFEWSHELLWKKSTCKSRSVQLGSVDLEFEFTWIPAESYSSKTPHAYFHSLYYSWFIVNISVH